MYLGLSIAKNGLDGAYLSLKNWSPKIKFTKSNLLTVESFRSEVLGVAYVVNVGIGKVVEGIVNKAVGYFIE